MNYFNKIEINKLQEYSRYNFEGYLWYSDKASPEVINGVVNDLHTKCTDLPFIVEGFLYSEANKISIHIRNYDGKYHIGVFTIDNIDISLVKLAPLKYLASNKLADNTILPGIKFINFTHVFELRDDILSNNFKTWKQECKIFTGFEKQ